MIMKGRWISMAIVLAMVFPSAVAQLKYSGKDLNCTCENGRACLGPRYCTGYACYAILRGGGIVERHCFTRVDYFRYCNLNHPIFYCCWNYSFCNDALQPTSLTTTDQGSKSESGWALIVAIIAVTIVAIILSGLVGFHLLKRRRQQKTTPGIDGSGYCYQSNGSHGVSGRGQGAALSFNEDESQSMSGMGEEMADKKKKMKQQIRTQKRAKSCMSSIWGKDEVWHCTFQNMDVAVKCCTTKDENSWKRESIIYQTTMLRHDNVLGFRAADIYDSEGTTKMLLITDYHPRGSLFSVLQDKVLSVEEVLTLASSASCGLNHLHSLIHGTRTKPAIAHRDLKSKNVLVKENGEACLCDLGLAVMYNPENEHLEKFEVRNTKVGTKRYMAPEVLSEEISHVLFDGFKLADIYAFGLLLWEMLSRCQLYDGEDVAEYHEPYYNMIPADPTFEQMVHVVVMRGARPKIQDNWHKHLVAREMVSLMTSCWKRLPQSRLSALRLWKNLSALRESSTASASSTSTTSTLVSHIGISPMAMDSTMMSSGRGEESVVSVQTSL